MILVIRCDALPKCVAPLDQNLHLAGVALLVIVIIFMIGAFSAEWLLPNLPLEKLALIANDRVGWTAQAILFPAAFLATAVILAIIATQLPWRPWRLAGSWWSCSS